MAHTRIGKVATIVGKNTVSVLVEDRLRHPSYNKIINRSKKIMTHVSGEMPKVGDMIEIVSCRPISKTKHFEFVKKIEVK